MNQVTIMLCSLFDPVIVNRFVRQRWTQGHKNSNGTLPNSIRPYTGTVSNFI